MAAFPYDGDNPQKKQGGQAIAQLAGNLALHFVVSVR